MSGPGWYCDGCGDYRCHDGHESYSVAQRDLRTRAEAAEAALREAMEVLASLDCHPCIWCHGDPTDGRPHTPDCRLRAVLDDF